jgi:hypothetical protein
MAADDFIRIVAIPDTTDKKYQEKNLRGPKTFSGYKIEAGNPQRHTAAAH